MNKNTTPIVLTFSALDPSGREGIQADIETSASLGCHCTSVVTALCANGEFASANTTAISSLLIIEQARSILENMDVRAIKVGFTGSVANVEAIHSILSDYPQIPLIVQPLLCMWSQTKANQADLPNAISTLLLPVAELALLSLEDAHALVKGSDTIDATAQYITSGGCQNVLINQESVILQQHKASLFNTNGLIAEYPWMQDLTSDANASSTLAAAIASFRAHDCPLQPAVEKAQGYTKQALGAARVLGFNKSTPHRFFWADKNIEPVADVQTVHNTH